MSTKRDYKVVEMSFDNKDFEKNVKTSLSTIQKLDKALQLDGATQGLLAVEKAITQVTMDPILKGIDQVNDKFSALGVMGKRVLENLADSAVNAGKKIWNNTLGQIQSGGSARALNIANAQFKLEGLGVAWEKAEKDISAAVDGTAYGFDAAANTASQLATAGIELGEAYGGMAHSLKAVSGIAAMTNSSYEEIGYIFSQIASAGRLMGQDAMQISTRGINVTATLAKQLNKTTEEITEMQRKGEISFAMFAEAMNDAFGDQATKANNTFQGAMSNVKAALSRIGEIWYGPFYDKMITPLNKIREAINKIKKAFDDGDDSTRDFKDRITELLDITSKIFSYFVEKQNFKAITILVNGLNKVLDFVIKIGQGWEKTLGIFDSNKAVSENEKLEESLKKLTDAELEAAKAIWETGKYGNGEERISALKAAGFDEEEIARIQGAIDNFISTGYDWSSMEKEVSESTEEANTYFDAQGNIVESKLNRVLRDAGTILGNIKESIFNVAEAFLNIGSTGVQSFLATFKFDGVSKDIVSFSDKIKKFTENFKSITRDNEKIRKVFDSIFNIGNNLYRVVVSLFSIMKDAISSFATALKESFDGFDAGNLSVVSLSNKVADFIEKIKNLIINGGVFLNLFRKIFNTIKSVITFIKSIPSKLKPVYDAIITGFSNIADKIQAITGIDIKSKVKEIIEVIKSLFEALKDPFKEDENGETSIGKWFTNAKETILGVFDNPLDVFDKIKDWFKTGFDKIKQDPSEIIPDGFFDSLKSIIAGVFDLASDIDSEKLLKILRNVASILFIIASALLALGANKLIKTIQKPMDRVKTIVSAVSNVFKTLKVVTQDVGHAIVMDLKADAFIKFAIGIAAIAGAIVALGMVDTVTLAKGLLAISVCIVGLAGSIAIYNKTVPNTKLSVLDTTMVQFGISLGIMAAIVTKFGKMSYEDLVKGLVGLSSVTLLYSNLAMIVSRFPSSGNSAYKGIIALGVTLDLMIPFLKVIGSMNWWSLTKGLIAMSVTMLEFGAMAVYIGWLSREFNAREVATFTAAVGVLVVAVDLLIPFLTIVGAMPFANWVQGLAGFGLILAALSVVVGGLAALDKLGTSAAELVTYSAAFGVLAIAMNSLLPSVISLGALASVNTEAPLTAAKTIGLIIVELAGGLSVLSMFNFRNLIASAASLSVLILSFNALIPAILVFAQLDATQIQTVTAALLTIGGAFLVIVGILGAVNAFTAGGVVYVLLGLAATILSIGVMFKLAATGIAAGVAAIGLVLHELTSNLQTISQINTKAFKYEAKDIIEAFGIFLVGLRTLAPTIGSTLAALVGSILAYMRTIIPESFETLGDIIKSGLLLLFRNILSVISSLLIALLEAVADILEALLQKGENGKSLLERLITIIIDAFLVVVDTLTARIYEIVEAVVTFVLALIDAIATSLIDHADDIKRTLLKWWAGMAAVREALWDALKEVGGKCIDALWEGIKSKGTEIYNNIQEWVKQRQQNFRSAFGITTDDGRFSMMWKLGKGIVQAFINGVLEMNDDLIELGKEFWNDFVDGIELAAADTHGAVGGLAAMVLSEMKFELDEHSPSKKTLQMGKYLVEGLRDGINDKSEGTSLKDAAKNLGSTLLDTIKDSVGWDELKESFTNNLNIDNLLNGVDTDTDFAITPVIDTSEVESGLTDIDSMFDSGDYNLGLDTSTSLASGISASKYDSSVSSSGYATSADMNNLATTVQAISDKMDRLEVRIDSGALVGAITDKMNTSLGTKQVLAGRGVYA